MATVRLSHKRVFLGEGIMIEVILACGNDPAQVGPCRRRIRRRYWQIA